MFGTFRLADESERSDNDDDDVPRYSNDITPSSAICSNCFESFPAWHSLNLVDCTGYQGLQCDVCRSQVSEEDINKHREEVMRSIPGDIEGQTNNAERCIFITKAINAAYEGRHEDIMSTMSDMIADMMHLCVLTGVDIDNVISGAKSNFLEEFRSGGMACFRASTKERPLFVVPSGPPIITHTQTEELEPTIV